MFDARLTKSFAAFCLFLLFLMAAYYWPWLSGEQAFYQSDLVYYFEPFVRFICNTYRQGQLPLWNPYLYCGMSQLAVPSPGIFYPPVVCFFLPFSQGMATFLILHQLIAGAGMFLLIAGLGWGAFAAIVAGLSFALSGYMFALQANFTLVATIAWVPLLLYLLNSMDSTFTTNNIFKGFGCAAVMALMIAAGRPELSVPAAMVAAVFVAGNAIAEYLRHRQLKPPLVRTAICLSSMLFGVLLAAPVILPALEWAHLSPRSKGLELKWVLLWSATWYDCLLMICAQPAGDLTFLGNKFLNMVASRLNSVPYLQSTYLGPLVINLAIWSLFDRHWKWRWGVVLLGLAALVMALGQNTPVAAMICRLSPALAVFRYPVKLMIFPLLTIVILAARGAMAASERTVGRGAIISTAIFWLAWLICGMLFLAVPQLSNLPAKFPWNAGASIDLVLMKQAQSDFGRSFVIAAALGLLVSGAYWLYARSKINRRQFVLTTVALLTANLLIPAWKYLHHGTAADFYDREPPLAYLIQQVFAGDSYATTDSPAQRITHRALPLYFDPLTPTRFFISTEKLGYQPGYFLYARHLLLPNNNVDYQIPYAFGYEAAEVAQYKTLFSTALTKSTQNREHKSKDAISDAPMARFCKLTGTSLVLTQSRRGVPAKHVPSMDPRYFTQTYEDKSENVRMFKPVDYLPRAYFATALRQASYDEFFKVMMDDHCQVLPAETFVDRDFPMPPSLNATDTHSGKLKFLLDQDNEVVMSASAASRELLVLNDQFYPGWQATIDGTPTTIYRVNFFARAVWVPPGNHRLRFVYRPESLSIGFACVGIALAAFMVALILCRRRRTLPATQPVTEAADSSQGI